MLGTIFHGRLGSNSRFGAGCQFPSEIQDELHHLVLSTRHGGQLGSEVHDYTHESLDRDLLRANGLRGGGRGDRRRGRHCESGLEMMGRLVRRWVWEMLEGKLRGLVKPEYWGLEPIYTRLVQRGREPWQAQQ